MAVGTLENLAGTYHIPDTDLATSELMGFRLREIDCNLAYSKEGLAILVGDKRLILLSEKDAAAELKGERKRVLEYITKTLSRGYCGLLTKFFRLSSGSDQLPLIRRNLAGFEPYIYPEEIFAGKVKGLETGKGVKVQLERRLDLMNKRKPEEALDKEDFIDPENLTRAAIPLAEGTPVYFTAFYVAGVEFTPVLFWPESSRHVRP